LLLTVRVGYCGIHMLTREELTALFIRAAAAREVSAAMAAAREVPAKESARSTGGPPSGKASADGVPTGSSTVEPPDSS
jgi:hypothetical protein